MTRAKRAMTIVLHPESKTTDSLRFSQVVREAIPESIGEAGWYLGFDAASDSVDNGMSSEHRSIRPSDHVRTARLVVKRRLPSKGFHDGQSAGELFAGATARTAAIERGVAAHAEFERVEWIAEPKDDFERALAKPEGLTALWREKPFEVFADGAWVSGRFDRVVFANGRATILDFKTNAIRRGESDADFEARMRETYSGQMRAYRAAVCALTGLKPEMVSAKLLLTAVRRAVDVI